MSSASEISIDEMYRALEKFGIKRETLEKLHPTETITHLYLSIKKQQS